MIDANARTGRMDRCDELFQQMQAVGVQPDIITFSTLVKGYCMDGDIDKGFAVLKDMTSRGKHEPDEILYNSLLDGCAKQHRVDDALGLIESMAKNNVRPSNFTLSILVKLLGGAAPEPGLPDRRGHVQALRPAGEHPRVHLLDLRLLPEPPAAARPEAP